MKPIQFVQGFFLQERPINCPWISRENRWFPVKISHIFWENLWFPVDFSLKPIHCGFNETILKGDGDGLRCSLVPEIKVLGVEQKWHGHGWNWGHLQIYDPDNHWTATPGTHGAFWSNSGRAQCVMWVPFPARCGEKLYCCCAADRVALYRFVQFTGWGELVPA